MTIREFKTDVFELELNEGGACKLHIGGKVNGHPVVEKAKFLESFDAVNPYFFQKFIGGDHAGSNVEAEAELF